MKRHLKVSPGESPLPSGSLSSLPRGAEPIASSLDVWTPLPESLAQWVPLTLHWIHDQGKTSYLRTLAPLELRPLQVSILLLLSGEGPRVQARLAERLRIDKALLVGLLNDLEERGLVERCPNVRDGRSFVIQITDAGQEKLQEAQQVTEAFTRRVFSALVPEEQAQLGDLLRRVAVSQGSFGKESV